MMNKHNEIIIKTREGIAKLLMKMCKDSEMMITPLHAALKYEEIIVMQFMTTHGDEMNYAEEVPKYYSIRPIGYKEENEVVLLINKLKNEPKKEIRNMNPQKNYDNSSIMSDLTEIVELKKRRV